MKIYDISQEVFGCQVYAGDPAPEKELLSSMEEGGLYNLTAFRMCAHNGTHIDAPFHFIQGGKTVDSIDFDTFIGLAYVAEHHGIVSADDAAAILKNAKSRTRKRQREFLSREMQRFLRKQPRYSLPRICSCLETNPKPLVLKMPRWRYTASCWEPVLYCLKESVWQRFRKAFIS